MTPTSNAIRHNVAGGRVEVSTRAEPGRALLSVANTGPLIPAGELQRLFQPFQRLISAPADGVGLGLAVVQTVADAHDAAVTAQTRADGGLEIDVGFPAGCEPSTERAPEGAGGRVSCLASGSPGR